MGAAPLTARLKARSAWVESAVSAGSGRAAPAASDPWRTRPYCGAGTRAPPRARRESSDDVADLDADGGALHLGERSVVDEREPHPSVEVQHAGEPAHAVERARLPAEVARQRGVEELVVERPVPAGNGKAVVEGREPGAVRQAEGGHEVVARHAVPTVEPGPVLQRAVGDRHAELLEFRRGRRDAGRGGTRLGGVEPELLGEELGREVVAGREHGRHDGFERW